MPGSFCNCKNRKQIAYTLAEVLIVMSIILLIILALPPVTKKVFKINDTRKAHGRYECYWKTNAAGEKELYSYFAEENGREVETNLGTSATYCEFQPTANSIYFIINAVGGGGAGAIVYTREIDNGDGTVTTANVADLEPKQERVQTTSNLAASNPGAWPTWVTWISDNNVATDWPWYDSAKTTKMRDLFDTETVDTKQLIRYRTSGTAGSIVSTFLPQLPGNVTLRIYPGKGGELSKTDHGSGGDGEDTKIMYIYEDGTPIEGLVARGGTGGNGTIDSKVTYSLVGGPSTDFDLSSKASIQGKLSGFKDVIEGVEKYDMMQTKVPDNAGDSGNGETQYVKDTNGQVLYEYNDYGSIVNISRRTLSDWKVITDKVGKTFYKRPYFTTVPNCNDATATDIEVTREGYCDYDAINSTYTQYIYKCAVGKIPSTELTDLTKSSTTSGDGWRKFTVNYDPYAGVYTVVDNPTAYSATTPFYNCEYSTTFKCKTKIPSAHIQNCVQKDKNDCANGSQAKLRSKGSLTYNSGSSDTEMKCPATGGGDGAVVILW